MSPLIAHDVRQQIGTPKSVTKSLATEKVAGSCRITDRDQSTTSHALVPTDCAGDQAAVAIQHRQAVEVTVLNQAPKTGTEGMAPA